MKKFINFVFVFLIFMITSLYFYIENTKEKSYIQHFTKTIEHITERVDDIYSRNKKLDFVSNKYFIKRKTFNSDIIVNDNIINTTIYDTPFDIKFVFSKSTMELSLSSYNLHKKSCIRTVSILRNKFEYLELVQHENNLNIVDTTAQQNEISEYCNSKDVKIFKIMKIYSKDKKEKENTKKI